MAEDRWIGKTIDKRYLIKRQLGAGGMGVVYEAEHVGMGRAVAVKIMRTEHVAAALLERFRREGKLASRIVHPNIVQVFDVGNEDGIDFIAMELVVGRDLAAILKFGQLPIARAVALTTQVLHALQAVHDAGIVHRDIKPSNVLVTDDDTVKLMDFGIARSLDDAALTRTGQVVGTTEFMSPEQLRGQPVDHRTDIYAIGITLFALLAGDLPFRGGTAEVAGAQVFTPPPSMAKLRPETPAHVVAALERALAKEPDERFDSAQAFASALAAPAAEVRTVVARRSNRDLATEPARPSDRVVEPPSSSAALSAPPAQRLHPPPRRSYLMAMLVGLGVVICAGVAIGLALSRHPAALAPPTPVASTVRRDAADVAPDASLHEVVLEPIDAATPPPDAAASVSGPAPSQPALDAGGRAERCACIPTDARDQVPLCRFKRAAGCRCDAPNGDQICTEPLGRYCSTAPDPQNLDPFYPVGTLNCEHARWRCPYDPATFHDVGVFDMPCSGTVVGEHGWLGARDNPPTTQGRWECDVCAQASQQDYRGHHGDACTGYFWRTGSPQQGRLDFCQ